MIEFTGGGDNSEPPLTPPLPFLLLLNLRQMLYWKPLIGNWIEEISLPKIKDILRCSLQVDQWSLLIRDKGGLAIKAPEKREEEKCFYCSSGGDQKNTIKETSRPNKMKPIDFGCTNAITLIVFQLRGRRRRGNSQVVEVIFGWRVIEDGARHLSCYCCTFKSRLCPTRYGRFKER